MLLGVIADDLTGATDVSLMLAREGMRVVQTVGVPASAAALPDADAVVVSMKSRTNPGRGGRRLVAAGLRRAHRRGRAADPVQVLLDLRQHRRG